MEFIERYNQLRFNLEFRELSEGARERINHNIMILAMAMDAPVWAEWGI